MLNSSESFGNIAAALLSVQDKFIIAEKNEKGHRNKFASYPDLIKKAKPILTEAGILLMQPVVYTEGGKPAIHTFLIHPESQEFLSSISLITDMKDDNINEAQQMGGGISYMKRYALAAMLAWATGDEDFDESNIAEDDKKYIFIKESFEKLMGEKGVNNNFIKTCVDGLDIIKSHENKKILYANLRDTILPEYERDQTTALTLLQNSIRDLS